MQSILPAFIIGCGDIGRRLAHQLLQEGIPVAALARTSLAAEKLRLEGITPHSGDLDSGAVALDLPSRIHTLFYFAPPPNTGQTDARISHCLNALSHPPRRIVYISTSGVYGDVQGRWIDENEPLNPKTDRARRRFHAESQLRDYATKGNNEVLVLRVPGIYGPGRLPEARIRAGVPVVDPRDAPWSNRIHADDLAQACFLAAKTDAIEPFRTFNISDGNPTTMTDYFWQVADHLGLARPPSVTLEKARELFTPAMMSFLDESKRLDNHRMREELGVVIRYPSLAEGLKAC